MWVCLWLSVINTQKGITEVQQGSNMNGNTETIHRPYRSPPPCGFLSLTVPTGLIWAPLVSWSLTEERSHPHWVWWVRSVEACFEAGVSRAWWCPFLAGEGSWDLLNLPASLTNPLGQPSILWCKPTTSSSSFPKPSCFMFTFYSKTDIGQLTSHILARKRKTVTQFLLE